MKKSDLKNGNVVELRNGDFYVLASANGESIRWEIEKFDIMKVYKDYTLTELLWERKETPKPQLTEDEKVILRNLPKEYKWIARDIDGCLYVYASKPKKGITMWESDGLPMIPFDHLFNFIKWEDEEPYSIEDLLEWE